METARTRNTAAFTAADPWLVGDRVIVTIAFVPAVGLPAEKGLGQFRRERCLSREGTSPIFAVDILSHFRAETRTALPAALSSEPPERTESERRSRHMDATASRIAEPG
jgi:hypothetical protein